MFPLQLLVLLVGLFGVWSAREADRVIELPGLDVQPTFKHYAGYLNATGDKKFFYWFIESERDPVNDPVVLWLNGGPGCSSLTGLLFELGPWRTKPDGSGLVWFEERWNKIANMIFMESPQCVGYSYAIDDLCVSSDNQTALDNHEALKDFFVGFPEYKNNEFFVTGESYAGIYVPTLSARIVDDPEFNFKGFAVGNSVTDRELMLHGYTYFAWARGLFSTQLWNDLVERCCVNGNWSDCDFGNNPDARCRALYTQVTRVQWSMGLNPYDVYAECYGGVPDPRGVLLETETTAEVMLPDGMLMDEQQQRAFHQLLAELSAQKNVTVRIPCSDTSDREIYLNRPDVRAALHVPDNVPEWLACSSSLIYFQQYADVRAEYYKILERGYRILSYYGDLDQACDHLSGMWFIESLGEPLVEPFKEWLYPDLMGYDQIAGFVIQYRRMNFVSVKGAGHFVPTDKPVPSFIMFEKFLTGELY